MFQAIEEIKEKPPKSKRILNTIAESTVKTDEWIKPVVIRILDSNECIIKKPSQIILL